MRANAGVTPHEGVGAAADILPLFLTVWFVAGVRLLHVLHVPLRSRNAAPRLCNPVSRTRHRHNVAWGDLQCTDTPSLTPPPTSSPSVPVSLTERFFACRYWTLRSGESHLPVDLRYQVFYFSFGFSPVRTTAEPHYALALRHGNENSCPFRGFGLLPPRWLRVPIQKLFIWARALSPGALGSSQVPRPSGSMSRTGREHTQGESQ